MSSSNQKYGYTFTSRGHVYHCDTRTVLNCSYPLIAEADSRLPGHRRFISVTEKMVDGLYDRQGQPREPRFEYTIRDYELSETLVERFKKGEASIAWEEAANRLVLDDIDSKADCEYILFAMLGDLHLLRAPVPGDPAF